MYSCSPPPKHTRKFFWHPSRTRFDIFTGAFIYSLVAHSICHYVLIQNNTVHCSRTTHHYQQETIEQKKKWHIIVKVSRGENTDIPEEKILKDQSIMPKRLAYRQLCALILICQTVHKKLVILKGPRIQTRSISYATA